MKAKFHSKYNTTDKNGKGIVMFRYIVSGTESELQAYKEAQADFYRESDDGQPYFFTPNWTGDNITLGITSKGKVFADTANIDKGVSLMNRYPGQLGQEIAKLLAAQLMSGATGQSAASTLASAPAQQEASGEEGKLDE